MNKVTRNLTLATVAIGMLAMFATAKAQPVRNFGEIEAKSVGARKAGIGGLRVQREGPEELKAEWRVMAEAIGLKGELLGLLEIRYPTENRESVSFIRANESETYQITVDDSNGIYYEFEHVGVESFSMRPLCDPLELVPEEGGEWNEENLAELRVRMRECSSQVEIIGTGMSFEEIIAKYQGITDFLAAAASEVRRLFGIPAKGLSKAQVTGPGQAIPQKIGCGPGQTQVCNFGNHQFAVLGTGSCSFCDETECCTNASEDADFECQVRTVQDCCANSFCTRTSLSGCGLWCQCQLIGYHYSCEGQTC